MPARSYSKRSRQPSGNAARCNDPASEPTPAALTITQWNYDGGSDVFNLAVSRPAVWIPSAVPTVTTVFIPFIDSLGVQTLLECEVTQITELQFHLDPLSSPSAGFTYIICDDVFQMGNIAADASAEDVGKIRALDGGRISFATYFIAP